MSYNHSITLKSQVVINLEINIIDNIKVNHKFMNLEEILYRGKFYEKNI